MGSLVQAAVTTQHRLGALQDKRFFLTVLEARSPRSRQWQAQYPMGAPRLVCMGWGQHSLESLLIRTLISSWGPTLMTSSGPDHLPKTHLQVPLCWSNLGGHSQWVAGEVEKALGQHLFALSKGCRGKENSYFRKS